MSFEFPVAMAAFLAMGERPRAPSLSLSSSSSSSMRSPSPSLTTKRPNGHRLYGKGELISAIASQIRMHGSTSLLSNTSQLFDIPRSTLYDHVSAKLVGRRIAPVGHPTLLSEVDEHALAKWIDYQAKVNLPARLLEIRVAAAKLAIARNGPSGGFRTASGLPCSKWWTAFNKRRTAEGSGFVIRRAHHLHPNLPIRSQLVTWIGGLRELVVEHNITVDRVFNVDETGLDGRYGRAAKLVVPKGTKEAHTVSPQWRGHFTLVVCICADGTALPPHWIAQGTAPISAQHTIAMLQNTIPGAGVSTTKTGWMDNATWSIWLQFFIDRLRVKPTRERPVLLILDSHESRFAWASIEYAMNHHVIIYAVLPNSTSICQPLDDSFNAKFKVHVSFVPCLALAISCLLAFSETASESVT
jgi:hypothetical protein